MVGANTFRNPGHTAKLATTLDHLSDGRAVLGIGGAWFEREHDGLRHPLRGDRRRAARPPGRVRDADAPPARRRAVQPRGPVLHDARRDLRAAPDPGRTCRSWSAARDPGRRCGPSPAGPTPGTPRARSRRSGPSSTSSSEHCADVGRDLGLDREDRQLPDHPPGRPRPTRPTPTWRSWPRTGSTTWVTRTRCSAPPPRPPMRSGPTRRWASRPSSSGCPRHTTARRSSGWPGRRAPRRVTVVALAGGTGGAKLAHGLQLGLPPGELTVVANTADDTERHGLLVMPDHDADPVHARRPVRRGARLGDRRRDVGRHGRAGAVRRGGLVPARRSGFRDPHRAWRAARTAGPR